MGNLGAQVGFPLVSSSEKANQCEEWPKYSHT